MINRTHPCRSCGNASCLALARSTAYYQPTPVSETVLALMRRIDELHLQYPFAGARMLRDLLRQEGHSDWAAACGHPDGRMGIRRCVSQALHQRSGIPPIGSTPISCATWTISRRITSGRRISPIFRCVGASCISSPSWTGRVAGCWPGGSSNTLTTDFCLDAVQEAVGSYGCPRSSTRIKGASLPARSSPGS